MSDRLDQKIRSMVVELVESSPAPHPAQRALRARSRMPGPVTLRSGLVRALVVGVVVLVVGLAGAWIGRNVLPGPAADLPIVEGTPGPEPSFDTSSFGDQVEEVRLLPTTGDVQPDVNPATLVGEVVAVGQIEGTDLEVFTWRTSDPENGICVQVVGFRARHATCGAVLGNEPDVNSPFVVDRLDETTGEVIDVVGIWQVPDRTSITAVSADDNGYWQRPVSGITAFVFPPDTARVVYQAYDTNQEPLAAVFFSPVQTTEPLEPGDTEVQGAPDDLVELDDSHAAMAILSQGATGFDAFTRVATDQGLSFVCGGSEGFPSWELCLVADDGVLAVVPFNSPPGLTARLSDPNLTQEIIVPLDRSQPVGITNLSRIGQVAAIEYRGQPIGELSGPVVYGDEVNP